MTLGQDSGTIGRAADLISAWPALYQATSQAAPAFFQGIAIKSGESPALFGALEQ